MPGQVQPAVILQPRINGDNEDMIANIFLRNPR